MVWKIKRWGPKVTMAEDKLRMALEKAGLSFQTQKVLQGRERQHCVDFYFAPDLVVEVDGASHGFPKQEIKDAWSVQDLENAELPFRVVRFQNHEIDKDITGVVEAIKALLKEVPK